MVPCGRKGYQASQTDQSKLGLEIGLSMVIQGMKQLKMIGMEVGKESRNWRSSGSG
nr:hypothetical protein Q903MT_gene3179 [Picea sitchensis]